jgi:sulfite reductase alpha subunit-like flavoprotein
MSNGTHVRPEDEPLEELETRHNHLVEDQDSHHHDEEDDRKLLILYASQTGGAQDVAEYIGREAWRRHFKARVQDVRDFDKVRLFRPPLAQHATIRLQADTLYLFI